MEEYNIDIKEEIVEQSEQIEEPKTEYLEEKESPLIFKVNHNIYSLRFNLNTIEQFEKIEDKSMNTMIANLRFAGSFTISQLRTIFLLALVNTTNGKKIEGTIASKIFEAVLSKEGVQNLTQKILSKINNDCPFLLKA